MSSRGKLLVVFVLLFLVVIHSCSDEEVVRPAIATKAFPVYDLNGFVIGETRINKFPDAETQVVITLDSLSATGDFPVLLRDGYLVENTGTQQLRLNNIIAGKSETLVTTLDDGTLFSFEDWLDFTGYVAVYEDENTLTTPIYGGDVGAYELSEDRLTFNLDSVGPASVVGNLLFTRREDSTQLISLNLSNLVAGKSYSAYMKSNSFLETGSTLLLLGDFTTADTVSLTQLTALTGTDTIKFNDLNSLDASVIVQENSIDVAVADIGENALTSTARTFLIDSVASDGVDGTLVIMKRVSGFTLAEVSVSDFQSGNTYPIQILSGDTSSTASAQIILDLDPIGPTDSLSKIHIELDNIGMAYPYDSILSRPSHLVIRKSPADNTVISKAIVGN